MKSLSGHQVVVMGSGIVVKSLSGHQVVVMTTGKTVILAGQFVTVEAQDVIVTVV